MDWGYDISPEMQSGILYSQNGPDFEPHVSANTSLKARLLWFNSTVRCCTGAGPNIHHAKRIPEVTGNRQNELLNVVVPLAMAVRPHWPDWPWSCEG
jgi:hypothetical protein